MRFGMGFIAPLGRSRSFRYMFMGDVNMWRSFVIGRIARNARNATTWMAHSQRCVSRRVCADHVSTSVESGYPTNDHFSNAGRPSSAIRTASIDEPGDADDEERAEDDRVLGLGLDADPVGRWM